MGRAFTSRRVGFCARCSQRVPWAILGVATAILGLGLSLGGCPASGTLTNPGGQVSGNDNAASTDGSGTVAGGGDSSPGVVLGTVVESSSSATDTSSTSISANAVSAAVVAGDSCLVQLAGQADDDQPLSFEVVSGPQFGALGAIETLGDTTAQVLYSPAAGFSGADQFTYVASARSDSSPEAIASVTVYPEVLFDVEVIAESPQLTIRTWAFTNDRAGVPDGTYVWHFDDVEESGPMATHATREHTFAGNSGTHVISLTLILAGLSSPVSCSRGVEGGPKTAEVSSGQNDGSGDSSSQTVLISGRVLDENAASVPGVTLLASDGRSAVTSAAGDYSLAVLQGWSGSITPTMTGRTFTPTVRSYSDLANNVSGQDFTLDTLAGDGQGILLVTPTTDFNVAGPVGGPFESNSKTYTLINAGSGAIDWSVSKSANWVTLSSSTGVLAPGGVAAVVVSLGTGANTLPVGAYVDTLAFRNLTNAMGDTDRGVTLTVNASPGPELVLDVPEPSASRQSPAAVFASIDFEASSTHDGSTWDQCQVFWTVERAGGLNSWPAKYRNVTDPRPGHSATQRDLSFEGRGFNMAWVLSAGTWTITCTVTNPLGEQTTVSSSPIVVAANTRSKCYINSATGSDDVSSGAAANAPYRSLVYALSRHGDTNNIEYVLAGNHVETLSTLGAIETGAVANAYIHWDGAGVRPVMLSSNADATTRAGRLAAGSTGQVWEGLTFVPGAASASGAAIELRGTHMALIDCHCTGSDPGNRYSDFIRPAGNGGPLLVLGCTSVLTRAYSMSWASGGSYEQGVVMGCQFGRSVEESIVRNTAPTYMLNLLFNTLIQDTVKSTLRFTQGDYCHAFGNVLADGDLWLGNPADNLTLSQARIEANYLTGDTSVGGNISIERDVNHLTICNNIFEPIGTDAIRIQSNPAEPVTNVRIYCNTMRLEPATLAVFIGTKSSASMTGSVRGNLIVASPDTALYQTDVFVDSFAFDNNVWTPNSSTDSLFFARYSGAGLSFAQWLSKSFTGDEQESLMSLNGSYQPAVPVMGPTPPGVFDDYYGNVRGVNSAAGAVN